MANHDLNFSSPGATIPTPDPLAPDPFAPRDPLTLPGAGLNPGGITSRPQMSSPMLNSLATPVAPAATANLPVSADQARTYTTQINALADERAAVLASASAPSAETLAALDARRDQLLRQIATTHSWQENGPEMAVLRQVLNQREAR